MGKKSFTIQPTEIPVQIEIPESDYEKLRDAVVNAPRGCTYVIELVGDESGDTLRLSATDVQ